MVRPRPDVVLLVDGTFSYRDQDEPAQPSAPAVWWQEGSEFIRVMDGLFAGRAVCWPDHDEPGCRLPWAIEGYAGDELPHVQDAWDRSHRTCDLTGHMRSHGTCNATSAADQCFLGHL